MKHYFSSINALFSAIAPSYDRMNDVMSLGLHHVWKKIFVDRLVWNSGHAPLDSEQQSHRKAPLVYVDMACGTGDIGGKVIEKAKEQGIQIQPIFVDPNPDLLEIAKNRYPHTPIQWLQEYAETVSIPENTVDIYTISFGLRNVENRAQSLKKAWDILAPGGQFWCLEFAHPENPIVREAFYAYLKMLPLLGQGVIGQSTPYAYLAQSIRDFPCSAVLLQEITQAGFKNATYEPLFYGIVSITGGVK